MAELQQREIICGAGAGAGAGAGILYPRPLLLLLLARAQPPPLFSFHGSVFVRNQQVGSQLRDSVLRLSFAKILRARIESSRSGMKE
ncbi:hypothetical protein AGIG_G16591 [Arapaima gigas]